MQAPLEKAAETYFSVSRPLLTWFGAAWSLISLTSAASSLPPSPMSDAHWQTNQSIHQWEASGGRGEM
jgi:hypothetical protein